MDNFPLVTVIVISYNSSATVLETLESISAQDYSNICLIIADDCSTDDTVKKVNKWVRSNINRFFRVEVVVSKVNVGVANNCNNGLKKAEGKYLKLIAGDDILLQGCISSFVDFSEKNACEVVFSDGEIISELSPEHILIKDVRNYFEEAGRFLDCEYPLQKKKIFERNFLAAPTAFFSLKILRDFKGFDKRFFMEDYPLWLKFYAADIRPAHLKKKLVGYRVHYSQSTRLHKKQLINTKFLKQEFFLFLFIQRKHYPLKKSILILIDYCIKYLFILGGNKVYFNWLFGKYRSLFYKLNKLTNKIL